MGRIRSVAREKASFEMAALPRFLSILDFGPDELAACLSLAGELKAARRGAPAARPAARGPARRAAVRKAVAAHAFDVSNRGA